LVARIIEETPKENLTNRYLEILGDYVMDAITKEEKRSHMYLTENRLVTVNKRETSYEGLVEKLENGEDGIHNLISDNKNEFLQHKAEITPEDIAEIPGLKELREEIENIEEQAKRATGRNKYLLKKQIIEMRRDQYVLKSIFKPVMAHATAKGTSKIELNERRWIDKDGEPQSDGLVTFFNPKHISAILCYYSDLKASTRGKFQSDFYCLIEDFDVLMRNSLAAEPVYKEIVRMRIRGC
jgi:hypothetical protein